MLAIFKCQYINIILFKDADHPVMANNLPEAAPPVMARLKKVMGEAKINRTGGRKCS
jgi:hypothetical protein